MGDILLEIGNCLPDWFGKAGRLEIDKNSF